jgi:hypothetical protein
MELFVGDLELTSEHIVCFVQDIQGFHRFFDVFSFEFSSYDRDSDKLLKLLDQGHHSVFI